VCAGAVLNAGWGVTACWSRATGKGEPAAFSRQSQQICGHPAELSAHELHPFCDCCNNRLAAVELYRSSFQLLPQCRDRLFDVPCLLSRFRVLTTPFQPRSKIEIINATINPSCKLSGLQAPRQQAGACNIRRSSDAAAQVQAPQT